MATDSILRSYGDVSRKEDVVLNAIEILTAKETQIFNMLPKTTAINTIHSYLQDTLRTAATLAVEEAADYTASANSTPTRKTNIVQISALNFKVSRTQQNVEHYHGQNELARQTQKALMDWANSAEFDLVRQTLTSGVSGTAAKMEGIIAHTSQSTNHTSHSSGTTWSASILDGMMKNQYDNGSGKMATHLFMGSFLRKETDGFTQKTNMVVNGPTASTIVRTTSNYENSFGTLMLHTHRYIQVSGTDATGRVLAIRPEGLGIAFLEKPYIDMGLARSGDYDNRAIVGKFTLECKDEDNHWYADGFDID